MASDQEWHKVLRPPLRSVWQSSWLCLRRIVSLVLFESSLARADPIGCSQQVKTVSRSTQQALAFKAVFYLLLFTSVVWLVLVAALEFTVQDFVSGSNETRTVGDGAVFSSRS